VLFLLPYDFVTSIYYSFLLQLFQALKGAPSHLAQDADGILRGLHRNGLALYQLPFSVKEYFAIYALSDSCVSAFLKPFLDYRTTITCGLFTTQDVNTRSIIATYCLRHVAASQFKRLIVCFPSSHFRIKTSHQSLILALRPVSPTGNAVVSAFFHFIDTSAGYGTDHASDNFDEDFAECGNICRKCLTF